MSRTFWRSWLTVLHQGLDLISQRQGAELSHGEHITWTDCFGTDTERHSRVIKCISTTFSNPETFVKRARNAYTFSSVRGGISIVRYSLRRVEVEIWATTKTVSVNTHENLQKCQPDESVVTTEQVHPQPMILYSCRDINILPKYQTNVHSFFKHSLWSFDQLRILRRVHWLTEQVLPFMLRAPVLHLNKRNANKQSSDVTRLKHE